MDYDKEIDEIIFRLTEQKEQIDKDKKRLNELLAQKDEYNKNMVMKDKVYLLLHQDDKLALCYVKDVVDNIFVDCNSIFCSNNETVLSFNDRFHIGSLKVIEEIKKDEIKNILNCHLKIFQDMIEKFCNNYGDKLVERTIFE